MDKMLKCPFCGGKPHIIRLEPHVVSKYQPIEDDGSRHAVECRYPGCMTRTIWCEKPKDAVQRWNKRVSAPQEAQDE